MYNIIVNFEVWLSLVERFVRDEEAVCSNPVTSTRVRVRKQAVYGLFSCYENCGCPLFVQDRPGIRLAVRRSVRPAAAEMRAACKVGFKEGAALIREVQE